jgi:carbon starvation protein CstA
MLSIRNKGENIPEVVGDALGMPARQVMRLFSIILLILVGVVFVMAPAKLLGELTGFNVRVLTIAIFVYYFAATILPIDKIIGRFYPFFGGLLLFMTFGIVIALIVKGYDVIPNMDFFKNYNPRTSYDGRQLPLWPLLFITISCGAISGFHSTQSPLMSRCLKNEKMGRPVFYGAMITEGIIALLWATVGLTFYKTPELLNAVIVKGTPSAVVNEVSRSLLGTFGGFLAVLGVIVLPITSGDTAFRSTRLIIADVLKVKQTKPIKRLLVAVPLFIVGYFLTFVNFQLIWRYFGWSNQTLAMLVLWSSAVWLLRKKKCHWIASIPATFMTAVTVSFIMYMKIGFQLSYGISNVIGITAAVVAFICFMIFGRKKEEPEKKD